MMHFNLDIREAPTTADSHCGPWGSLSSARRPTSGSPFPTQLCCRVSGRTCRSGSCGVPGVLGRARRQWPASREGIVIPHVVENGWPEVALSE